MFGIRGKQELTFVKEQASRYPNVKVHIAYMPEMFGTHHSKVRPLPTNCPLTSLTC
jgi:hypothetical protein